MPIQRSALRHAAYNGELSSLFAGSGELIGLEIAAETMCCVIHFCAWQRADLQERGNFP